jgi:hypothetical protein
LMYATDEQVGRELKCPDCGAMTVARRSAPKKPVASVLVELGEDYDLDPASAPEPRPVVLPIAIRDAELHAHARATTVGPDGRLIVQKDDRVERPVRPAVPLLQGVWPMMFTQEVVAPWIMSSILFGGAAWFISDGLMTPLGIASMFAILMIVFGMALTLLWLTIAAPTCLAIVAESSEGHDRLYDPPAWSPLDWISETMYLLNAIALAGMPGMIAWGAGAPLSPEVLGLVAGGVAVAVFPLAYMGALLENTAFGVISPKLLGTLVRRPGPWLLFYVELAILAVATAGACWGLARFEIAGRIGMPLIAMAALFLLMRLMGRLAWWLADILPAADGGDGDDDDAEVDDAAAAHPNLAAARAARRAEARAEAAR